MSNTKICPYCAESIKVEAVKCKHCHSMLNQEDKTEPEQDKYMPQEALTRKLSEMRNDDTSKEATKNKNQRRPSLRNDIIKGVLLGAVVLAFIIIISNIFDDNDQVYGDVNGWEYKRMSIPVGTNPPSLDEISVVGTELSGRKTIEGTDLAKFGENWNGAVRVLEYPNLQLSELDLTYQKFGVSAEKQLTDWLMVYAFTCYNAGYLDQTLVEWELTPDIDGAAISSAWVALIYATIPDLTSDEINYILDELGVLTLTTDELSDLFLEKEIGDYVYRFYSTDRWGDFEIQHKDW